MNILQVSPRYYPSVGGVETHVQQVSERLIEKGHHVVVACTDNTGTLPSKEIYNGVCVRRFKSWAPNEAFYFSNSLKNYLLRESRNFDIVHAHNYHAIPALYASRAKNTHSFIFTPHFIGGGQTTFRNLLHHLYKLPGKTIFNKSKYVICVSEFEKQEIIQRFSINEEKIKIIPNGVNIDELQEYSWNPLQKPYHRICSAGRFERRQKNIDKLIESIQILVKEKHFNVELALIGSGPFEKDMRKLIKSLELTDHVRLKKFLPRDEFLHEVSTCDLLIMPSDYECYGIMAAEAIVMGVPTLVTNSSALQEFVRAGLAMGIPTPVTPSRIAESIRLAFKHPIHFEPSNWKDIIVSWDYVADALERTYLT